MKQKALCLSLPADYFSRPSHKKVCQNNLLTPSSTHAEDLKTRADKFSLQKQLSFLAPRQWLGMSAPWPLKFHTDDVNQCFHNKSGSLGVPNVNLFCFMFPQSIMVKFCVLPRTSSSKTQMLLLKKYIHSSNIDCIVVDSSRLHLTFVAFCLLLVTHKQQLYCKVLLHQPIRAPEQTPDRFYVISMEFLQLRHRCPSWRSILSREETGESCFCRLCPVVWDKWSSCWVSNFSRPLTQPARVWT